MNLKPLAFGLFCACSTLCADNLLRPGTPRLDRPTLTTLGVQLPVTGDDNFNATVSLHYRVSGTQAWQTALPLFRVHPETVAGYTVAPQLGGSIFDLKPGTTYELQLHAVDPDGLDQTFDLTAATRVVPGNPTTPRVRNVTDVPSFQNALSTAAPGDVITLANGVYPGSFFAIYQAGTPTNPIVIRGQSEDGVILDGGNCGGCNIFEIYGAGYVHLERMTLQNATRAIRIQQPGATEVVIRRVHIRNTDYGIGGRSDQNDTYIADNILEGRIAWPHIYSDDGGVIDASGISVFGFGAVVAHNKISGFEDAMRVEQDGARADDFYGNDVVFTYDNCIELDGSEGNTRFFRNRCMNTFAPLSVQPIHGGPAYLFRNVVVNIAAEQLKFHPLGVTPNQEPSGVLVYHNTFVSPPNVELNLQTTGASHYFEIENNLFTAPPSSGPVAVDWTGLVDHGTFDYNGYFPDGIFRFNTPPYGYFLQRSFSGLHSLGIEQHGLLTPGNLFASGLTAPSDFRNLMAPADVTPAAGSLFLDRGRALPNINDNFQGSGPDLGAIELGCPAPTYGPRPEGIDESNEVVGCAGVSNNATSVVVSPSAISLGRSQTQQFTTTISPGGGSVSWSLSPARGSITSSGLYTAPGDALMGERVTVTAVSAVNGSISGVAQVSLTVPVAVSLSPSAAVTLAGTQTQQFTASVSGAVNTGVSWTLAPPIGSITIGGLFTAPAATSSAQSINVTAVTSADTTKTASTIITVPAAVGVNPTGGGLLQGTANSLSSASLTSEGTVDWAHWGQGTVNRKALPSPVIGNLVPITNGGGLYAYGNDPRVIDWSDGAPSSSSAGNRNGVFVNGTRNGFSLIVPAGTAKRVLHVHVGGWNSSAIFTATLSDGSAAPFTENIAYSGGQYNRDYTLTYNSANAGQNITLAWIMTGGSGNVTWNAASLANAAVTSASLLQGTASSLASVSLTAEGTLDWAHWGEPTLNRKALPSPIIGAMKPITTGNSAYIYGNDPRVMDWSDGATLTSTAGDRNGLFIFGTGNGFSITVPAATTSRVLRLHVGGWFSSGRLTATLSDGSVTPFAEDVAYQGGQYNRDYVLSYSSPNPGQSIVVTWTMTGGSGNVTWNAASLGTGSGVGVNGAN